jgi:hypothetical protein
MLGIGCDEQLPVSYRFVDLLARAKMRARRKRMFSSNGRCGKVKVSTDRGPLRDPLGTLDARQRRDGRIPFGAIAQGQLGRLRCPH